MAAPGLRQAALARERSTRWLLRREDRLRRWFTAGKLNEREALELAAVRLVLEERQERLPPCDGLPAMW